MKIGIGLPAYIPAIAPADLIRWAKKAEEAGFSSLGSIDRLVFKNYEPLIALTAAAAVTQRIRLMTTVLLAPLRNTAILAKQAATLDAISGGRLTLGLGVGAREADFKAAGVPFEHRGGYLARQLRRMRHIWNGQPLEEGAQPGTGQPGVIGPAPARQGGPEILLGGYSPSALKRAGRLADGYISGGGVDPEQVKKSFQTVREAWQEAGRAGGPRFVSAFYVALGAAEIERGREYLRSYYGDRPIPVRTTATEIEATATALADAGVDEIILWPVVPDLSQVDRIAGAAEKLRSAG